jgi:hypothetical protein
MRRYVLPDDSLVALAAPVVLAVPVVLAASVVLVASAGAGVAFTNVNRSAASLLSPVVAVPVVPVVPAVPAVPVTPAVPAGPTVITPCFRQPVTVICASVAGGVPCGADDVCAPSTVAKPTIAVDIPVQIVLFILMHPPGAFRPATGGPHCDQLVVTRRMRST